MLNNCCLIVLLLLCAVPIAAQNKTQIPFVDQEVVKIQKSIRRLQVRERDLSDVSSEGARTKAFYDKNEIRKISGEIFGETGKANVELFYQNGKLIFVNRRQSDYDKIFGKIIKTTIQKFYFANDKLIRLIAGGKSVSQTTPEFSESKQQVLDLSNKILDNFKE